MNPYQFFNTGSLVESIALYLLILLILFLLFREVFTWYWKFTKMVSLLEKIEENTRKTEVTMTVEEKKSVQTDALGIKN